MIGFFYFMGLIFLFLSSKRFFQSAVAWTLSILLGGATTIVFAMFLFKFVGINEVPTGDAFNTMINFCAIGCACFYAMIFYRLDFIEE